MVDTYNAHDQGEAVKKWLQDNGSAIVMGLVIAFGGLFGFKQWQNWQDTNRQQASYEFEVLNQQLAQNQLDAAMDNFQILKEDHAKSPYASMAALQMARARLEANQADLAISLFEYVVENGYPKAMQIVARERLARVLLDQGQPAEALTVLQGADDTTGFESRFAEVRGDIQFAQGRNDEAAAAYLEALDALEAGAGDRARLVMKLESLGAEVPAEESQS
jgi:predicted negative regulator of RcsB-dependent stress response